MPFSRRPISRLLIESQILKLRPWNDIDLIFDLDLRHVKQSLTDVKLVKIAFFNVTFWPQPNDLDTQT